MLRVSIVNEESKLWASQATRFDTWRTWNLLEGECGTFWKEESVNVLEGEGGRGVENEEIGS